MICSEEFVMRSQTIYMPATYRCPNYKRIDKQLVHIMSGYARLVKNNSKWNRFSCDSLCYMLATEYLWIVHHHWRPIINIHANVSLSYWNYCSIAYQYELILRWPCFLSLALHDPSIIVIVYFVTLCYINDFTISESMHDCTALIPACCPFKPARVLNNILTF